MSTQQLYTRPVQPDSWEVPMAGAARFSWEYDDGRDRLLALYQKGKDKQWDATTRIDWSVDVNPDDPMGLPQESMALHGTPLWESMGPADRVELARHHASWQFSQFLHGEQGALVCASRIVESVPDLDAKFYAATQVIDEARHVEVYGRFLQDKIGLVYPVNPHLQALLDSTLSDSRWDMPYLGMQVLIEGLALAAFGVLRDVTTQPLPRQILAYVMQDEARHVAFGRMALKDYYAGISDAERAEREDFVVEACWLMRDRLRGREIWETLGYDVDECDGYVEVSPYMQAFRSLLFARIVPIVRDIGLWGEKVQSAYAQMGVLDLARSDLDALMRGDEEVAERLDAQRREEEQLAARREQVAATVAAGAG